MSGKSTRREELQTKIDRVHAARLNAEQFIDGGGDLNFKEAMPIGMELLRAATDLSGEFGAPSGS
jgi:hypothetical protein